MSDLVMRLEHNPLGIVKDWLTISDELEKNFSAFKTEMDNSKKQMLDELKKGKKDIAVSDHTFMKEVSEVEQRKFTVGGITLEFSVLNFMKERDGVRLPHLVKQIECFPPCSIDLLLEHSTLKETINDEDQWILT